MLQVCHLLKYSSIKHGRANLYSLPSYKRLRPVSDTLCLLLCCVVFFGTESHYGLPGTRRDLPAFASRVLELKAVPPCPKRLCLKI